MRSSASLPDTPTLLPEVAERWSAQWGTEMTEAVAEALAAPPAMDLTLKDAGTTQTWAETLGGTSLLPGHVRLNEAMDVTTLPGFAEGAWWVQDLAASFPARLLGAGEGQDVLDLCAAPGGKTMQQIGRALSGGRWGQTG